MSLTLLSKATLATFILVIVLSGIAHPQELIRVDIKKTPQILKKINTNVQLKENKWIKIVDDYYDEVSTREIMKEAGLDTGDSPSYNHILRTVVVWVQFLKPCSATSKLEDLRKQYPAGIPEYENRNLLDNMVKRYKCDYRTNIFVIFFNEAGIELESKGSQPIAALDSHKTEILPGEKIGIDFLIPSGAVYYYSWVPK